MSWREKIQAGLAERAARLDRFSPRERVVLTLCICVVLCYVLDLVAGSARGKHATWQQLLVTQQDALSQAKAELEGLSTGRVPAGDPALREQLADIGRQSESIDASLRASQQYLVPPETMSGLLQDLLRRNRLIQVLALQTLPVTPLLQPDAAPDEQSVAVADKPKPARQDVGMFRHGVQLIVRGEYLNVLTVLQGLEKLPAQMYWGRLEMETLAGEQPVFSVWIYTLSLDRTWLQI